MPYACYPLRFGAGQGLNMALEDGAVLAAHVQTAGLSTATLRAFERERIPRVAAILRQESVRLALTLCTCLLQMLRSALPECAAIVILHVGRCKLHH